MCRDPMRKHGRTASGSQRWRCTACNLTTTAPRAVPPARTEQATLGEFIAWATSKGTQADQPGGARAFRRRTAWCWRVPVPRPPVTGEVHAQIFIDGLHLAGGWTLLVARSTAHVIAWQWAAGESAAAYTALLQDLAPPDLVTTDGAGGALKALRELWPRTPVQRCLIHVHRDTVRDPTLHPRTTQGRALLGLSRKLLTITTTDQAAHRPAALNDYATEYRTWLNQRTTDQDDPATAAATGRKWWYTPPRTRRAHRRLERLAKQGTLFAYLTGPAGEPRHTPLERTTNPVEAINAQVRATLRHLNRSGFDGGGDDRKDHCHGTEEVLVGAARAGDSDGVGGEGRPGPVQGGGAPDRRGAGNPPRGSAHVGQAGRDRPGRPAGNHHRRGPAHQGAGEGGARAEAGQ